MQSVVRSWVLAAFAAFSACVPIAADASSLALSTPSGLNVGDTFRFIFVTAGTTAATSTDISRYDEFVRNDVSTQYGTVTYGGSAITEWLAVGSTANINANVHIGTGTGASYRGIYLPGGSRVAASEAALWSVTLDHAIDQTLNGGAVAPTSVWTGTAADGASGLYPLGGTSILDSVSIFGQAGKSIFLWVSTSAVSNGSSHVMYGISPTLTVSSVPEIDPATGGSALSLVAGVLAMIEQRRRRAIAVA